ncbi:uncharacterized protein A1O9_02634 [Exophiala aquamarina CBS 119918]|uniref:CoA-transferase family III n=1 Tax=Exophiala aquamarina CBS 119918 TaxID=1182545 RepID=A0A072PLT2_9EURO|nr:uncharacterized protein A1O9_02634 [Exophiala aquamarina CBS 119918]KEF61069.1 hypothetical protein A1O9_02634 [Exophiala aquamarina CBS 119918]
MEDRGQFDSTASLRHLWRGLNLPVPALASAQLPNANARLPSSFKIGILAQSSIALTALLAALIHSVRTRSPIPRITVSGAHAVVEFKSERLYTINGEASPSSWGPIGGLHKTVDGYVRVHDGFPVHRDGTKALLGCGFAASKSEVAAKIAGWKSVELETAAFDAGIVISALRSFDQWDILPQAKAVRDFPIQIQKVAEGPAGLHRHFSGSAADKCLRGLRVVEMSRVIATPVAGKTLAAHGADVLWVSSPTLPDQPGLDRDFGRGKRTIRLNIDAEEDKEKLFELVDTADVFLQGFRPGSLASRGLSAKELATRCPQGIICANMSAYGPEGPWRQNRGFDSLVQTCSGMNVSEAEHYGKGEPARPTPCQALDHAGGYFLAAGIMTALYRQATEGGSYEVNVSLAGVMKYLRGLGQYLGDTEFQFKDFNAPQDIPKEFLEERESAFGLMKSVSHSAAIEGVTVGWEIMPKPLGADKAEWLYRS